MKVDKIENMKGGWFVGNFEPTAYKTPDHTLVTEINYLIRGEMTIQNTLLQAGDIFTIHPYEISDPEFLTDCELIVVKTPSANDKIDFKPL